MAGIDTKIVYDVIFFDLGETLVTSNKMWLPGAKELLAKLKNSGVRIGIVSNTAQLNREGLLQILPADFNWNLFDKKLIILSSEVNIEKPNLDIFRLAVSRAGIKSESCLFCSENSLDCLVAQHSGMHSFTIQKSSGNDIDAAFVIFKQLTKLILKL